MAKLPDDLLRELLLLLPINSLFRFMSVSKSWHSLIKSPWFSRIHHLKQQELNQTKYISPRIIVLNNHQLYFIDFSSIADLRLIKMSNVPSLKNSKNLKIKEFQSCNGVLCLHCSYRKVVIWNPLSDKYRELHSPIAQSGSGFAFGFGYDRVTGDYKLVALQVFVGHINIHDDIVLCASVYSVKSCRWKSIDGFSYRLKSLYAGVFLHDSLHWLTKGECIVAFDLTTDQFHEIPLPSFSCSSLLTNKKCMNISVFSDCLTLTRRDCHKETLYVMKSYGAKDSWKNLRLDLSPYSHTYNLKPIACIENGKLAILGALDFLLLYDTEKNQCVLKYSGGEARSYIATLLFYGGKLHDAGKEGGTTKRVSEALAYRAKI